MTILLCVSLSLQVGAAAMGFHLARKTGRTWGWLAISAALLLMAAGWRRSRRSFAPRAGPRRPCRSSSSQRPTR
jgi:hypothetical protein